MATNSELKPSLATGAKLNAETWADFVRRLKYHCEGKGTEDHCTADPLFVVQNRRLVSGIDMDYADQYLVYCDDSHWFSPKEYWDDLDELQQDDIDAKCREEYEASFLEMAEHQQWDYLGSLENHTVTGYAWQWEYVNAHFTREAAEAFINRKKHDYGKMQIFVDSQYWAWEFNAIRNAILDGKLVYSEAHHEQ
ncbi:hypothetical protein [Serratia fonticola]|uniref:hypothetical protein n=1 Tax=Serratia fonticola TaxID=47917 RepID=UPI00093917F9|nr:hypothetical protein [Serratia fonticola]OKP30173.1 hypothetical protein BSQ40_06780 [Serratia fonticola]